MTDGRQLTAAARMGLDAAAATSVHPKKDGRRAGGFLKNFATLVAEVVPPERTVKTIEICSKTNPRRPSRLASYQWALRGTVPPGGSRQTP